ELEHLLAHFEVLGLDPLLRVLDGPRHLLVLDRLVVVPSEAAHETRNALRAEKPHQVVFQRNVEAARARVALPSGAAPQLVVDAAAFVAFRPDDEEAPERDDLFPLPVALLLVLR